MDGIVQTVLLWVGVAALAALVWLVVEGALTVRSARKAVVELKERVEPTLAHVEQITESIKPAIDRLDPLMERASLTVDSVNLELMQIDKILSDTSSITGTASGAVQKISDVANAPSRMVNATASKLKGAFSKKQVETRFGNALEESASSDSAGAHARDDQPAGEPGDVSEASRIVSEWAREAKEAAAKRANEAAASAQAQAAQTAPAADAAPKPTDASQTRTFAEEDDVDIDEPADTRTSSQKSEDRIKAIDDMLASSSFFKD